MNLLGMIEGATGLFPKKVVVTLIHAVSGKKMGSYKMDGEQLPESFNKPIVLKIEEHYWRITKARLLKAGSYFQSRKWELHAQELAGFNSEGKYMVPSHAHPLPGITNFSLFEEFTIPVQADEWRQLEFLPSGQLSVIQEQVKIIESIQSSLDPVDALLGYNTLHSREAIGQYCLEIPFAEFCSLINCREKGNLAYPENNFVLKGFSLRSDNYVYYGMLDGQFIVNLALQQFDSIDDEIATVLSVYGLVLVDWCSPGIMILEDNLSKDDGNNTAEATQQLV